jgi:hypothetical protein
VKQLGCRVGNWLNRDQARLLLEKLMGKRIPNPPGARCPERQVTYQMPRLYMYEHFGDPIRP